MPAICTARHKRCALVSCHRAFPEEYCASMSEEIWFLNTWVTVRVSYTDGKDGLTILECRAPFGDSPPLHIHQTEDEVFHLLEGEFRFQVGKGERRCQAGEILLAPKGIPHTYRVESTTGGRWLTVTAHTDFERFVRAMGRPAERQGLPPAAPPSAEAINTLTAAARGFGIEMVGPPLA
jgi:quercetin dioxygenase-like cupin family protein